MSVHSEVNRLITCALTLAITPPLYHAAATWTSKIGATPLNTANNITTPPTRHGRLTARSRRRQRRRHPRLLPPHPRHPRQPHVSHGAKIIRTLGLKNAISTTAGDVINVPFRLRRRSRRHPRRPHRVHRRLLRRRLSRAKMQLLQTVGRNWYLNSAAGEDLPSALKGYLNVRREATIHAAKIRTSTNKSTVRPCR